MQFLYSGEIYLKMNEKKDIMQLIDLVFFSDLPDLLEILLIQLFV